MKQEIEKEQWDRLSDKQKVEFWGKYEYEINEEL